MKKPFLLLSLGLSLIISACSWTHYYKPGADTYQFPETPALNSDRAVDVINVNESTGTFLYGRTGLGGSVQWQGNLKEWTDVAVEITKRELKNRGIKISPDSPKTLKLSILEANASTGGWGFRGNVALKATTGNGYERVFQPLLRFLWVEGFSGASPTSILNPIEKLVVVPVELWARGPRVWATCGPRR
jgi:hypothetical protein